MKLRGTGVGGLNARVNPLGAIRSTSRVVIFALLLSLVSLLQSTTPSHAVAASECKPITDTGTPVVDGFDSGDIKITPLHGQTFYVDLKNGINASYIGYSIRNDKATDLNELWLEVADFRSTGTSVLSLANPSDAYQPIGKIAAGASKNVFVLIKTNGVSSTTQTHDVRIHQGYPGGDTTVYKSSPSNVQAECFYNFLTVSRTIAANANKVTAITVDDTSPDIGGTVTVTINGATGTPGSGTSSADGSIMWLSGASTSTWPTQALRLESTNLSVKYRKSSSAVDFPNTLILTTVSTGVNGGAGSTKFTNSTTYIATFTFRVMGGASQDADVKPVAQIASGTQIKHTGQYPAPKKINLTTTVTSISSVKSVESIGALSGGYYPVNYKVVLTDSTPSSPGKTIDAIVDIPESNILFTSGTAKITDSTRTDTVLRDPIDEDATTEKRFVFGGPFTFNSSGTITLTYQMRVPNILNNTYKNIAYGRIGSKIIAKTNGNVTLCSISIPSSGSPSSSCTDQPPPKLDQIIDFTQPPTIGVGVNYTLDATASSGLAVTFESNSTSICTVSGNVVTIVAVGTCSITASQLGNTSWHAATNVTRTFSTIPGQVISFTTPATMTVSQVKTDIAVSSNVGFVVTVTSLTPDLCTISSNTSTSTVTVTAVAAGQCVLVATHPGGEIGGVTYGAAQDVERTIAIGSPQEIIITTPVSNQTSSTGTATLAARSRNSSTTADTDLVITFVSKTPDVCTATDVTTVNNGSGLLSSSAGGISSVTVTWTKTGLCTFTANQDGFNENGGNSGYAPAAEVLTSFRIGGQVPTISITSPTSVDSAATTTITVSITTPTSYPTSTASMTGTVHLYASGTRVPASASQSLDALRTVSKATAYTYSFSVTAGTIAAGAANESYELTAEYITGDATVFNSVATQSSNLVTVLAPTAIPTAVTLSVGSITTNSATLNGSFHPQGTTFTTATMNFGTLSTPSASDSVGSYLTNTSSLNAPKSFSGTASGLSSATRYYFQAKAAQTSTSGTGSILSFMTLPNIPVFTTITPGANTARIEFNGVSSGPTVDITYYLTCTSTGNPTITANSTSSPFDLTGLVSSPSGVPYSCTIKARATNLDTSVFGGGYGEISTAQSFTTSPQKLDRTATLATSDNTVVYGSTLSSTVTGSGVDSNANTDGSKSVSQTGGDGICTINSLVILAEKVGTCTLKGRISEGSTYKLVDTSNSDITVTKKPLTVTAEPVSIETGSSYPGDTFSKTSLAFNDVLENVTFSYYNSDGSGPLNSAPTNAGTYLIRPSNAAFLQGSADNYSITYIDGTLTISTGKTRHTITFNALSNKTFGDVDEQDLPQLTSQNRNISFLIEDPQICELTGTAGNYKIRYLKVGTCTVTASSPGDATFFDATAAVGSQLVRSFTISALALTITAARSDYEYGGSGTNSFIRSTVKTGDVVGSVIYSYYDSTGFVSLGSAPTSIGTYKVRASGATFSSGSANNYSISYIDGSFTVSRKTVTITAGSPSKTFGESTPSNSFTPTTLIGTDAIGSVTYSYYDSSDTTLIGSTPTAAGTYKVRATSAVFTSGSSDNYTITYTSGTYTINTLSTTISVGDQSITYGQSTPTNNFSPPTLASGDSVSAVTYSYYDSTGVTLLASAPTTAGTYKIRASLPIFSVGSASNYAISFTDGTFVIAKKNHKITFTSSTLSAKTFGDATDQNLPGNTDANRAISYSVNDATICEITGTSGSYKVRYLKVGTCTVTSSSLGDDNFYDATAEIGSSLSNSFIISTLAATITVTAQTITEGEATPTNAYTRSSLVGTDEINSVTFTYFDSTGTTALGAAPTSAGSYKIRASAPNFLRGQSSNYTFNFVDGIFRINAAGKLDHKIVFRNTDLVNKSFGTDVEQSLPSQTSASRNISYSTNDTEICIITGTAGSYKVKYLKVGTCVVTAEGPGDEIYNDAAADTGSALSQSFVVSSKNVSITSADKSMTFGGIRPDNGYTRTDLYSDDQISGVTFSYYDLDGNLLGTPPSNAGTYKIRASNPTFSKGLSNNYNISYIDGTLIISKKDRTIEVNSISDLSDWGSTVPLVSLTISDGETDGTKSYELGSGSSGCTINAISGVLTITKQGVCKVVAKIENGSNHSDATSLVRSFTIGKKTQVLTLPDNTFNISAGEQTLSASSNATTNNGDLGGYSYEIDTTLGNPASTTGCSVTGNKLTFTQAGDCYVKVSRSGNTDYWSNASTIARFIITGKTTRTIRIKDSTEAGASTSYKIAGYSNWSETGPTLVSTVSAGAGDGAETFVLDADSRGCALDVANPGNGVITFTGAGTCKVKVVISEGSVHGPATSSFIEFTIGKKAQLITFPSLSNKVDGDSTDQDLPTTTDVGRNISFSVNDATICSIVGTPGNYKVRYLGVGTCNVTASETGNSDYHGANASAGSSLTRSFNITARAPREEAVVVKSRSIKILNNNEADAATSYNLAGYSSWDETPPVLVSKVTDGENEGLKSYSLDSTSKGCLVDARSGVVKFVSAGTCKIKVSITEANSYNAATSTVVSFDIGRRNHQIDFPKIDDKSFDSSIKPEPLPTYTSANLPIKYRTNDPAICEITGSAPNFSVTPKRAGTCSVFAESEVDDNFNPASPAPNSSLVRSFTISPKQLVLTAEDKSISFGQILPINSFTYTGLVGDDAISTVTFSYYDSAGEKALTKLPTEAGQYIIKITTVQFKSGQASNYTLSYVEAKLTIAKRARTITVLPILNLRNASTKQQRFNFSMSAGRTDGKVSFTLAPKSTGCALPDNSLPVLSVIGSGTCSVLASVAEGVNHLSAVSVVQSFTIGKGKLTLNWSTPKSIITGSPLTQIQLNPTSNVPGKFMYQPDLGTVLPVGKHQLVAIFEPSNSTFYDKSQVETVIEVLPGIAPQANSIVTTVNKSGKTVVTDINSATKIEATQIGSGIDRIKISGTQVLVYPKRDFAGKTDLTVSAKYLGKTFSTQVNVTVLPDQVSGATQSMKSFEVASISWKVASGANSYEVAVNGQNVCVTRSTSCEINKLIGPASQVTVTSKATDDTSSNPIVATYTKPISPLLAIVRNFDTASSDLKELAKLDLDEFASAIKKEGFTNLVVYGHTDSRQGIDNVVLSQARAQAAIDYLQPLLPNINFTIGFFAEGRPVSTNATDLGRAANRRVEIFLGG